MLALYPPAIFFDGLLQKSVLDVLFVCVSLARHRDASAPATRGRGCGRGSASTLGALSLTRENALVLVASCSPGLRLDRSRAQREPSRQREPQRDRLAAA